MKKNLISVIILALVLANLILTAILTFSVLPQSKKANELIAKVCSAIDLDLQGGGYAAQELDVDLDKVVNYALNGGEKMTINLTAGEDGVKHYAMVQVTLGLNSEHEDYKTYGSEEQLADKESMLQDIVQTVVGSHTSEDLLGDKESIRQEILEAIRKRYESNFVISVSYTVSVQ